MDIKRTIHEISVQAVEDYDAAKKGFSLFSNAAVRKHQVKLETRAKSEEFWRLVTRASSGHFYVVSASTIRAMKTLTPFEELHAKGLLNRIKIGGYSRSPPKFISHKWYGPSPDNRANDFLTWLQKELAEAPRGRYNGNPGPPKPEWLWIDYCCVPQDDSASEELINIPLIIRAGIQRNDRAGNRSNMWVYPHNQDGYFSSYWCSIEFLFGNAESYYKEADVSMYSPTRVTKYEDARQTAPLAIMKLFETSIEEENFERLLAHYKTFL